MLLGVDVHMPTGAIPLGDDTQHLVRLRVLANKIRGKINTQFLQLHQVRHFLFLQRFLCLWTHEINSQHTIHKG